MLFSPTTVLVTTINIAAVLAILYWARFLVKHTRENTEFADLLLQHERIEADTKPLGIWKGNVSKQQDALSTQQEARTARSAGGSRSRVLRNIDVWKRAKYEAVRKGPGRELGVPDTVAIAEDSVISSGDGVRQRRTVAFPRT